MCSCTSSTGQETGGIDTQKTSTLITTMYCPGALDYSLGSVTIDGLGRRARFDATSLTWQFDSVPAGSYDLLYSMPGYDTLIQHGVEVLAPSGKRAAKAVLSKQKEVSFNLSRVFVDTMRSPGPYVVIEGEREGPGTNNDLHLFFLGKHWDVSPVDGQYAFWRVSGTFSWGTGRVISLSRSSVFPANAPSPCPGFIPGDSLYGVLYHGTRAGYYRDSGWPRFLNLRRISNVVGTVFH
jgi:hypothetical protein